jgi:hypothetical protein
VPKAAAGNRAGAGRAVAFGAPPLRDQDLLAWCEELIEALFDQGRTAAGGDAANPAPAAQREEERPR